METKVVSLKKHIDIQEARLVAPDYYAALILSGWGLFRILEHHGFEPLKPKHVVSLTDASAYTTEAHVIECLAQYIASGGELVT
jgi:hypothetical protein|tara:strand:- start:12149 stop:12400 length:252 start_codon:yes stop_codon:yes gene_type:complete